MTSRATEAVALLMAGGSGNRMRASGVPIPKPLVLVRGATLLERNLFALFRAGVREIVVSVSDAPALSEFVRSRGQTLARAASIRLDLLVEAHPRGNVGCARSLMDRRQPVLLVYADNLTDLDLQAAVDFHISRAGGP